ncbi:nucleoporin NDC1-like [Lineus longissimus]|uniref:nucleoporin NDC1-like n=1 Tax=Lineus longissimus TaxID=88925 RepID=UPI002B4E4964
MENSQVREVMRLRAIKSLVFSIWRLPLFVALYLLLSYVSFLHPISWIQGTFRTIFTLSNWMYILLIGLINSIVAIISWKHFTVAPVVRTTRLDLILSVVQPDRLLHAAGHAVAGGTLTWCYANLIGGRYANLIASCSENQTSNEEYECLNEHHIFTVFHGAFVGLVYSVQFFLQQNNYMTFPVIQQPKSFQVQNKRLPLLRKSASTIFQQVKYYYLLFWLFGGIPKHWMLHTLGLGTSPGPAVNSLRGFLDAGLLWHVLVTGFVIHATWSFSSMLYKIYNTEPVVFPVETAFENHDTMCLHEALACFRQPLLKYLGYLDLFLLSKYSDKRRKQIFRLSQPGGHPHNWNYIVTECVSSINALTNSITVYNNTSLTTGPIKHLSGDKTPMRPTETNNNPLNGDFHHRHPESLTAANGGIITNPPPAKQVPMQEKFLNELKKKPVIAFFLQDIPDMSSRRLFVDCQKQIWALEALSEMVAASYNEDTFGVVQTWLPEVISSLLSLQEGVDKHFKLATNMVRRPPKGTETSDVALRYALKTTLKTAIYRITDRFADHLEHFKLSVEHLRRLRMFLDHKE